MARTWRMALVMALGWGLPTFARGQGPAAVRAAARDENPAAVLTEEKDRISTAASASESDDPEILVLGRKREAKRGTGHGKSVSYTPDDASRFDVGEHLKRDAAVLVPESGRMSPSGFTVPRIRGQDAKFTDVYVDDVLVHDPYLGMPLLEDVDLRAFGTLDVFQGIAPAEVPGLNPVGTLRFAFRPGSRRVVGASVGDPHGVSVWGLGQGTLSSSPDGDATATAGLYGRHYQTRGDYRFYSDEGTPYNTADDRVRRRADNDQRSWQALPHWEGRAGLWGARAAVLAYGGERGVPVASVRAPNHARLGQQGHVAWAGVTRDWRQEAATARVGLHAVAHADDRRIRDPEGHFLLRDGAARFTTRSHRFGMRAQGQTPAFLGILDGEWGEGRSVNRAGGDATADVTRRAWQAGESVAWRPHALWVVELKAQQRRQEDEDAGRDVLRAVRRRQSRHAEGQGITVTFGDADLAAYAQGARLARLPSLLEEYGDGLTVRAADHLGPETVAHAEAGLMGRYAAGDAQWAAAVFRDEVTDKIVFVPASTDAMKAVNLRRTRSVGLDARHDVAWGSWGFGAGVLRLWAQDRTFPRSHRIPGVPDWVAVGEASRRWGAVTARWLGRYRSAVYRDAENTVALPGALLHDAALDGVWGEAGRAWRAGLAVKNVLDLKSVPIAAPDTPANRGRTGLSDYAGAPLPGRQWILHVARDF